MEKLVFNRQRMVDNTQTLLNEKGLKPSDIDGLIGASSGYTMKFLKDSPGSVPSTEVTWKLAKVLGVGVDILLEGDFSQASDNLQYLARYFAKLKFLTDANQLEWEKRTIADMNELLRKGPDSCPIIKNDAYFPDDPVATGIEVMGPGTDPRTATFARSGRSSFYSPGIEADFTWVRGTSYSTAFNSAGTGGTPQMIYIFPMGCFTKAHEEGEEDIRHSYFDVFLGHYELTENYSSSYPPSGDDFVLVYDHVCNTLNKSISLFSPVSALYQAIARHEHDIRISNPVRSAIDSFMDDDNLPF